MSCAACLQVAEEFEYVGQASAMRTCCVYGGAPYGPQENALRRGVHVVIGTPGRIKDHIERRSIRLDHLQCGFSSAVATPPRGPRALACRLLIAL